MRFGVGKVYDKFACFLSIYICLVFFYVKSKVTGKKACKDVKNKKGCRSRAQSAGSRQGILVSGIIKLVNLRKGFREMSKSPFKGVPKDAYAQVCYH